MSASRGMTLLEVVLAVTLLGALFVGAAGWLSEVASLRAAAAGPLRWERSAAALLDRIADDVATFDFAESASPARIRLVSGELSIRTREVGSEGGPAIRTYRLDRLRDRVELEVREARLRGEGALVRSERALLGEVSEIACALDAKAAILEVRITPRSGESVVRRYAVP